MISIAISSFAHAADYVAEANPKFILSIVDPQSTDFVAPGSACKEHLILECHDVVQLSGTGSSEYSVPTNPHIEQIVDFARRWEGDLLVHCFAGVSRSAAAALIILAALDLDRLDALALRLREQGPWLQPNGVMVGLGDSVLGLDGRLTSALEAMGPARMRGVPKPVILNLQQ